MVERPKGFLTDLPRENIMRELRGAVAPDRELLRRYWLAVGNQALKYLARRPLTLVRNVDGVTFYHIGPLPPIPKAVHYLKLKKRDGSEGVRVWVDDLAGLLALLDMDAVEIHPWGSTVDDIERPDVLVFDLDPGENLEWKFVTNAALALRSALRDEGYDPWVKTSGDRGLDVMVPIAPERQWDEARTWARRFAEQFAKRDKRYTLSSKDARTGRLLIDYLRNGRGSTAVGAFSPRARPNFPVSYPVTWAQVKSGIRADSFTLEEVMKRAERL
jgi:bifunctional non-homologous end joining protein LigD